MFLSLFNVINIRKVKYAIFNTTRSKVDCMVILCKRMFGYNLHNVEFAICYSDQIIF